MISPAEQASPAMSRRYLWGLAAALAVTAIVALIEIDAQSDRVVDRLGRAWPFAVLAGPNRSERTAGWLEVITSGLIADPLYRALLSWYLVVDAIFIVAYAALLIGLVRAGFRSGNGRLGVTVVVCAAALTNVVENLVIMVLLVRRTGGAVLLGLLDASTTLKWLLIALAVVALIVRFVVPQRPPEPTDVRPAVRRTFTALLHHRFSVAMVVPLVVLTVLSGSAILEQLPDVQRRWASDGSTGRWQATAAVAAVLLVAFLLEVLARFRTGWAERHEGIDEIRTRIPAAQRPRSEPWLGALVRLLRDDLVQLGQTVIAPLRRRPPLDRRLRVPRRRDEALLGIWVVGVAIPLSAALLAWPIMDAPVLWSRLGVFCAVPLVVITVSWVLRRAWQVRPDWEIPDHAPVFSPLEVTSIRFTGHALALAVITIGGVGLIRSFLSVVVLGPSVTGVGRGTAAVFLALGVAAVVLPWILSWAIATGSTPQMPDPLHDIGARPPVDLRWRWLLLGVVLVVFVSLGLLPGWYARLGVSAVAIISLASLIGIPAAAGLLIQERPTAEVFRILGLRRTPLVSVLVITIVLAGLTAGTSVIHRVIDQPVQSPANRLPVRTVVQSWLDRPGGCEVIVNGQRVRPMIMIAAEGGGIRAAYWTVKGLAAIDTGSGGCGARSTLFSGGASGGSVGLTAARFSGTPDDPSTDRAVEAVRAMAEPRTLAEAVIGTFVRDPAYSATGVPLGTNGAAPAATWADRARLIELGWDDPVAGPRWGTMPFLTDPATLSPATGPLVLNSSSVASQCRVWLSQLELEQPAPTDGQQQCDRRVSPGARTVDLFAAYGPIGGTGRHCVRRLEASTAALLTARFPYVTPGGVVGRCAVADRPLTDFWPRTQLIDGGYIENTGLATITDLSAQWLAQVRTHNDAVVAGRSDRPLIMPFVVFLTNEQATAGRLTEPPKLQSELLLPAVGYLRGSATLTRTDALLQRVSTTVRTRSICPPPRTGPIDCDAISNAFPRKVIVVDRTAQPEVTAPLGWVLSQASLTGLDSAMEHQVDHTCQTAPNAPACLKGYGTLGDLLGYLRQE